MQEERRIKARYPSAKKKKKKMKKEYSEQKKKKKEKRCSTPDNHLSKN